LRALILCAAICAASFAQSGENALTPSARAAIEKAVLEVNAQMTRAAEDRDIDRLFSFMLPTERGSIALNGILFATREEALAAIKGNSRSGATVKYRWKKLLVTVVSPTTALLAAEGEVEIRTSPDGPPAAVAPFAQSVLFVLTDGQWKALHAHQSAVPR
jgi:hypothetical protein